MASLTISNLQKTFGAVYAIRDVSLSISDGEFVSLLGPSGCGKTTTLRTVAGLESGDSGTIRIGDRDVTDLPPRDRDIAMVFQDYALYPHMTVLENVGYPLKVRGVRPEAIRSRVQEAAARLQIDHLLERRPAQLSGGQQQRVALARAVVHPAQVTLYDEPLSNLDTQLRNEARVFLKHLQREVGLTSLYVTHDQAEAMALSDRIVVMNEGEVMQFGSPMDIYRTPANTFVAAFIGSPAMNLLVGKIDHAARLLRIEESVSLPFAALKGTNIDALTRHIEVKVGIRPEYIQIRTTPEDGMMLPVMPFVIQELGNETLVIARTETQHFITVRIPGDTALQLPAQFWLALDAAHIFIYGEDGKLIR